MLLSPANRNQHPYSAIELVGHHFLVVVTFVINLVCLLPLFFSTTIERFCSRECIVKLVAQV